MRADRLLSLLMLLQTRGRMTAQALAHELEVSERTIYRDMEALSAAGVPVYADRGPNGGCSLLDNYRTTLTGLTQDEVRALFMVSIPAPLDALGVSEGLKTARLKLSAALPGVRRQDERLASQRIHLDSTWWSLPDEPTPHLQTLHEAVWQSQRLHITLQLTYGFFETRIERQIDPYGLVAKASVWHVVGATGERVRVYRAAQVLAAEPTGERFERPADFDLATFWKNWCAEYEANRPRSPVTARVASDFIPLLYRYFGEGLRPAVEQAQPDAEGRLILTLTFESLEEARLRLLGLGQAIEVLEPEALRCSIVDFASQTLSQYGSANRRDI
jgi:predicted DNA-binding transcriptional regulator YafY